MRISIFLAALLVTSSSVAIDPRQFETQEMRVRYEKLINETRCLVCQNQNLHDSNAPLAKDLRETIAEMLEGGKSDDDIRKFLTDRYGDFVLYRPPFKASTAALWLGPLAVVLIAGLTIGLSLRKRMRTTPGELAGKDAEAIERKLEQLKRDEL